MNLTGRPVYQKGQRLKKKPNVATDAQRRKWERIVELGCIVREKGGCFGRMTRHHIGTGAGGRKDHDKVVCLCFGHHLGAEGIDSTCTPKPYSKKTWQEKYGQEDDLLAKTEELLKLNF